MALLLEAERQGLMNGDYVFFLMQHFEVSREEKKSTVGHIFSWTDSREGFIAM